MGGLSKVLITGAAGFTGSYLRRELTSFGYECFGLLANLLDEQAVSAEVEEVRPDYVVHLAGISYAAESDVGKIYNVNVIGSINLFNSLSKLKVPPIKLLLASTAAVYGVTDKEFQSEEIMPTPINHYACSKLCMEHMSQNYAHLFPITILRPFNYTGPGHGIDFLIPKIVNAYKRGETEIELGNLDVFREFNDVRDVCTIYRIIMESSTASGPINICTGRSISLIRIIELMDSISGIKMNVKVNPLFVRDNEIKSLAGDPRKLKDLTEYDAIFSIEDTLRWMYSANNRFSY
jgi:nucleoside-diphosphate-sugar epimerase